MSYILIVVLSILFVAVNAIEFDTYLSELSLNGYQWNSLGKSIFTTAGSRVALWIGFQDNYGNLIECEDIIDSLSIGFDPAQTSLYGSTRLQPILQEIKCDTDVKYSTPSHIGQSVTALHVVANLFSVILTSPRLMNNEQLIAVFEVSSAPADPTMSGIATVTTNELASQSPDAIEDGYVVSGEWLTLPIVLVDQYGNPSDYSCDADSLVIRDVTTAHTHSTGSVVSTDTAVFNPQSGICNVQASLVSPYYKATRAYSLFYLDTECTGTAGEKAWWKDVYPVFPSGVSDILELPVLQSDSYTFWLTIGISTLFMVLSVVVCMKCVMPKFRRQARMHHQLLQE